MVARKKTAVRRVAVRELSEAEIRELRNTAAEWRQRAATVGKQRTHAVKRRKNAVPPQEEINRYVAKMDREILYATGAYGRKPTVKDWRGGKDFMVVEAGPMWPGGTYFSIRDVEQIYGLGYRKIVFGGTEGFDVDLVME